MPTDNSSEWIFAPCLEQKREDPRGAGEAKATDVMPVWTDGAKKKRSGGLVPVFLLQRIYWGFFFFKDGRQNPWQWSPLLIKSLQALITISGKLMTLRSWFDTYKDSWKQTTEKTQSCITSPLNSPSMLLLFLFCSSFHPSKHCRCTWAVESFYSASTYSSSEWFTQCFSVWLKAPKPTITFAAGCCHTPCQISIN